MSQVELEACPFCGDAMDDFAGMSPGAFAQGSDGTFAVNCHCGAMGPSARSMAAAVASWNNRSVGFCAVSVRNEEGR